MRYNPYASWSDDDLTRAIDDDKRHKARLLAEYDALVAGIAAMRLEYATRQDEKVAAVRAAVRSNAGVMSVC